MVEQGFCIPLTPSPSLSVGGGRGGLLPLPCTSFHDFHCFATAAASGLFGGGGSRVGNRKEEGRGVEY